MMQGSRQLSRAEQLYAQAYGLCVNTCVNAHILIVTCAHTHPLMSMRAHLCELLVHVHSRDPHTCLGSHAGSSAAAHTFTHIHIFVYTPTHGYAHTQHILEGDSAPTLPGLHF